MIDLLEHSSSVNSELVPQDIPESAFKPQTWLPVMLFDLELVDSEQELTKDLAIQEVKGQLDLLARGYTPFREIGKMGIIHMVHTYVNDTNAINWSKEKQ